MNFEKRFSKLQKAILEKKLPSEINKHFTPEYSLKHMFEYLWTLDNLHKEHFDLKPIASLKCEKLADIFKNEGNRYYKQKSLDLAIDAYNKCILIAPHPTPSYKDINRTVSELEMIKNNYLFDNKEYKSLSLSLANRSAVLYELREYEKCIRDCDLSILYGYPKLIVSKLQERKAKCYMALKNLNKAKEILDKSIGDLDNLGLDPEKLIATKKSLENNLKLCIEDKFYVPEGVRLYSQNGKPIDYMFKYGVCEAPTVIGKHPTIPSLSNAAKVVYTPERGRYLVAARDILPGEVIIAEKSYCSVVLMEKLGTHCSECLSKTLTPLPCPTCSKVVFCSENCRIDGLNKYHRIECNILKSLEMLDVGENGQLTLRLLVITKLQKILETYHKNNEDVGPELVGFNDDGIYDSNDYSTIFNLVSNKDQRSVADLFKRTALAIALVKLLLSGQEFFCNDSGEFVAPSNEELFIIGDVAMLHLMQVPCNAHSITEFATCSTNLQESVLENIGAGAYGTLSLCNHSCNPVCARTSFGSFEVLRSIAFIGIGEEITDTYGKHFAIEELNERQNIAKQYYFKCSCEPCTNNWPCYGDLSKTIEVCCLSCPGVIDEKTLKCSKCDQNYSERFITDEMEFDYSIFLRQFNEYLETYTSVYKYVLLGDSSSESISFLKNFLALFRFIKLPNQIFFEAQETLKHCFDKCSTHYTSY